MASLAKKLDQVAARNKSKKLAVVINLMGQPTEAFKKKAQAFAKKAGLKHVVVTVTAHAKNFNVDDDAEVTVMNYRRKVVKFNYSVGPEGLKEKDIRAILDGVRKIL